MNVNPKTLEQAKAFADAELRHHVYAAEAAVGKDASPIELDLAVALQCHPTFLTGVRCRVMKFVPDRCAIALPMYHPRGVFVKHAADESPVSIGQSDRLYAVSQVPIGDYRVDFLVSYWRRTYIINDPAAPAKEHDFVVSPPSIVVECDGHDFHERTKEQAARDKARDRYFASLGLTVLRFTGSEIYRDAFACVEQIVAAGGNAVERWEAEQ